MSDNYNICQFMLGAALSKRSIGWKHIVHLLKGLTNTDPTYYKYKINFIKQG